MKLRGCQKCRRVFLSAALPLLHRPSDFTALGKAASGAVKNRLCGRTKFIGVTFGNRFKFGIPVPEDRAFR